MTEIPLDPIVAALASTLEMQGNSFTVPEAAIDAARVKLRASAKGDKKRLAHDLIAWATKLGRLGGTQTLSARVAAARLALELLGDEAEARDLFGKAGLGREVADAIGGAEALRAPRAEDQKPALTVKATRGLRKF